MTRDEVPDDASGREVRRYLERGGIPGDHVASWEPIAGGSYNTLYRVRTVDGSRLVLKIAPAAGKPCLRYERDLLRGEITYYRALAGLDGVPVPSVIASGTGTGTGTDASDGGRPFLLMTECPGGSWSTTADTMASAERARLRESLGRTLARVHTVTGPGFGYPAEPFAPLGPDWRRTFTGMADAVLADAVRFAARLPEPVPVIRELMEAAAPALEEVAAPVAVHFDLWEGNVLLDGPPGARGIGGIVDGERMMWGDPLADFPSLLLLGAAEDDPCFMAGYRSGGGVLGTDDASRARLALYRCYLYLIMLVETVPRRVTWADLRRTRAAVLPALEQALETLAVLTGTPRGTRRRR